MVRAYLKESQWLWAGIGLLFLGIVIIVYVLFLLHRPALGQVLLQHRTLTLVQVLLQYPSLLQAGLLAEGPPVFYGTYLIQMVLLALSALMLVAGIVCLGRTWRVLNSSAPSQTVWRGWGMLSLSSADGQRRVWTILVKELLVWMLLLLAIAFLGLFVAFPLGFGHLAAEDYPIEWMSALFCFMATGILVFVSVRLWRRGHRLYALMLLALSFVLLVIGGEEVSWFQRVFSFQTPASFAANAQGEFNLHNFATSQTENAYYGAAFLFLILTPFVFDRLGNFSSNFLAFFAPGRFILYMSVILAAYNYDMWNIPFTQLEVFATLWILLYLLMFERVEHGSLLFALAVVYVLSQLLFLLLGYRFWRSWDVTEYKEFFIPLAFVCYAVEMWCRTRVLTIAE